MPRSFCSSSSGGRLRFSHTNLPLDTQLHRRPDADIHNSVSAKLKSQRLKGACVELCDGYDMVHIYSRIDVHLAFRCKVVRRPGPASTERKTSEQGKLTGYLL
jgi:hypothetical protein